MTRMLGLVLVGGLLLGEAATARAQVGVTVGNPWTGRGITVGVPGAYGYGVSPYGYGNMGYGYGNMGYGYGNMGYGATNFVTPGWAYSSGYSGYATPYVGGYGYSTPYYGGYSTYSYPAYGYGYGVRRGFGVLRRWR